MRRIALVLALLLLPASSGATAPPPEPVEAMYADAVGKEAAVRKALADDDNAPIAVLKAVRTAVSDFETIVRLYPSSGYSDDALWRAGLISLDAFNTFGEAHDLDACTRLLRSLASQYPSSKLAKHVPEVLELLASTVPKASPKPAVEVSALSSPVQKAGPTSASNAGGASALSAIRSIRRDVLPDAIRITIEVENEVPFHEERIDNPSRIFVDFSSSRAVPALVDKTLRFDGDADPVHQIRIGRHPGNVTRVVLDAIGVSSYSVYALYKPYRLVIDCVREKTTMLAASAAKPAAPAARTVVARPPPLLRSRPLAVDFVFGLASVAPGGTSALAAALAPAESPIADIATITSTPTPPAMTPLPAPERNMAGGLSLSRQLGLGVSKIVIDPGHGGHDPGATGNGVNEAELVLDVALRLEKLLQKLPDVEVILTRRTDEFVALQERTAIANREGADLFLSIHANASADAQTHGIETYYLNFAKTLGAAAVAARENAASGQSMAALPDFVKSIALNNKLDESREFATDTQHAMIDKLRPANKTVRDLGVKQAPFMVLIGAAMPSVLTEISFVTNSSESKLLKSPAYRQRIADALFTAVRAYQTSLRSEATVAQKPE
jgi:N-acetylmuramoyl-L-alanine amidase